MAMTTLGVLNEKSFNMNYKIEKFEIFSLKNALLLIKSSDPKNLIKLLEDYTATVCELDLSLLITRLL